VAVGSGISWVICKSAPCLRQITMPASHHLSLMLPNQQRQSIEGKLCKLQSVCLSICPHVCSMPIAQNLCIFLYNTNRLTGNLIFEVESTGQHGQMTETAMPGGCRWLMSPSQTAIGGGGGTYRFTVHYLAIIPKQTQFYHPMKDGRLSYIGTALQ